MEDTDGSMISAWYVQFVESVPVMELYVFHPEDQTEIWALFVVVVLVILVAPNVVRAEHAQEKTDL